MVIVKNKNADVGAKAAGLMALEDAGFPVPETAVIPYSALKGCFDAAEVRKILGGGGSPSEKAARIAAVMEEAAVPEELASEALSALPKGPYAVRSSAGCEDGTERSFAGIFESFLGVKKEGLGEAVLKCLASLFSEKAIACAEEAGTCLLDAGLSVIAQPEIRAVASGACFTSDPIGKDTDMRFELAEGTGEALLSGKASGSSFTLSWLDGPVPEAEVFYRVMAHFGRPCDIEFAWDGERLWVLQARPVTEVSLPGPDCYTSAVFRNGGISAEPAKGLIFSLYNYIWEHSISSFLTGLGFVEEGGVQAPGIRAYGRAYWNASLMRECAGKLPFFSPQAFDSGLGVTRHESREEKGSLREGLPLLGRCAAFFLRWTVSLEKRMDWIRERCGELEGRENLSLDDAVCGLYLFSERTYFTQIFINTIWDALTRRLGVVLVGEEGWLKALSSLDTSHTRLASALAELAREGKGAGSVEFSEVLSRFGYHAERELDLSCPRFSEDPEALAATLKNFSATERPSLSRERVPLPARPLAAASGFLYRTREELKDLSTRTYAVVRKAALSLGERLEREGIAEAEAVFEVPFQALILWERGKIGREELACALERERRYRAAFVNFDPPGELGGETFERAGEALGVSPGRARGRARVLRDGEGIASVRPGEILVSRFADTGWAPALSLLSGLVTETGGALCHAAVIAREYGIPSVACAEGACDKIKTGDLIEVDGAKGEVYCLSENGTSRLF